MSKKTLCVVTDWDSFFDGRGIMFVQRCPICDKRFVGNPNYCGEYGSKV